MVAASLADLLPGCKHLHSKTRVEGSGVTNLLEPVSPAETRLAFMQCPRIRDEGWCIQVACFSLLALFKPVICSIFVLQYRMCMGLLVSAVSWTQLAGAVNSWSAARWAVKSHF